MTDQDLERRLRDWMDEEGDVADPDVARVAATTTALPPRRRGVGGGLAAAAVLLLAVVLGGLAMLPGAGFLGGGGASADPARTRGGRLTPSPRTTVTEAPSEPPTEAPTEPTPGTPLARPTLGPLESIANQRVTSGGVTCVTGGGESIGSPPTTSELDALVDLAGGVDRFISEDRMYAGELADAMAAFGGTEVIASEGDEAWILVPDRNGDPGALGILRSNASSVGVWVRWRHLYRCDGAPTPDPNRTSGRLDPTCLPVGAECGEGTHSVVPGIYLRNDFAPGVIVWFGGGPGLLSAFKSGEGSGRLMTMDRVWETGGDVSIQVRAGCTGPVLGSYPPRRLSPGADLVLVVDVAADGTVSLLGAEDLGAGPVADGQLLEIPECSPG